MNKKNRKKGLFSAATAVFVLAAAILANILVTNAGWSYDVTENEMYTLSDQTKQIVKNNEKDITLYVLSSQTDFNIIFRKIVNEYDKISDHLNIVYKDLENYPNFAYNYIDSSSETAAEGSIIVECGDKFRYLSSEDFVSYTYDYYTYAQTAESIDLEFLLTEAINYVISEKTPAIYTLTGHNEAAVDSAMEGYLQADNYELRELNLLTEDGVPEDCEILLINGPTTDISMEDKQKVMDYLEGDGKVYFIADPLTENLDNFESILKTYGIIMEKGVVIEADSGMYTQIPTYLLPTIGYSQITSSIQNQYVLVPVSKGFTHGDDTEEYTITSLLATSDSSYSKINTDSDIVEKEEGDVDGPFDLALQVDTEEGGKLIVLGSVNVMSKQIDEIVSGANSDFVMNGINYLAQQEDKISVRVKELTTNTATFTAFAQKALMVGTTFVLPGVILFTGIFVVLRRRKM